MKDKRKKASIKRSIIAVFILAMLITIGSIGYLVFRNWFFSARQTTRSIAIDTNESIYAQVNDLLDAPHHVNELNHKIIENGILVLSDEKLRDKFFVGVLSSHGDEIHSFSYATAGGEYYGARRNLDGEIEIMRNNADTGGNTWFYSVNEEMTAGGLVVQRGQFDPRTQAWYKTVVETGGPAFAPVYKHFVMNDLTVSAAWPVYDKAGVLQGVLVTHMLLTDIGDYLEAVINKYDGYAVIFERDSGNLIANSMGIENFSPLQDGGYRHHTIDELGSPDIRGEYENYYANKNARFLYEGEKERLFVNAREINLQGIDWVVISAIPESFLMKDVLKNINITLYLVVFALALSIVVYNIVSGRLLKPIKSLLRVSGAMSSGDLSKRVEVVRNDEIGSISESLNKVADKMQYLINNLEANVKDRTEELHKTNLKLEESKNQLQLILDSTAEAVYGLDLEGKCTFCNISCIKVLGYNSQEDLLGKNMHQQIHHSRRDGTPFPAEDCRIMQTVLQQKGFDADDEVFWRANGTSFDVEYHSYPQIRNGKVIGAVITFTDITDRKQKEAEIDYLSCHDILTGLHNRRCFEINRVKIDTIENLPLSVIFADINGLKMTNDIFGHAAGDELIKKSAEILKQACRDNDTIARVGGDEFIILLPNTDEENAAKVLSRIRSGFMGARVAAIKCSISLGSDTKIIAEQSLEELIANAENAMYKDKTMNRQSINKDIIDTIVETLHSRSSSEKRHSQAVGQLCTEIGFALNLPEPEMSKLKRAGYLHDIGKIILDESLLHKDSPTEEEQEKMRQHPVVGYRILNLFDDTLDLAEYIFCHHERWDGTGYPRGLKGEQIPLISRIVSIAETYERVLSRGELKMEQNKLIAEEAIRDGAGTRFDPRIAELFVTIMRKKYGEQ